MFGLAFTFLLFLGLSSWKPGKFFFYGNGASVRNFEGTTTPLERRLEVACDAIDYQFNP